MIKSFKLALVSFAAVLILLISYSATIIKHKPASSIILGACTPGDPVIKSLLGLPADKAIDFIRWEIVLNENSTNAGSFILNINYGVSQPNTLGFVAGGEKQNLTGSYIVSKSTDARLNGDVFRLKQASGNTISFVKLNDNLFHLLDPADHLISGDAGWSYTLNRKETVAVPTSLPALVAFSSLPADTSSEIIYEGRTPCMEIAGAYNMQAAEGCFKLKWKLTLKRDPSAPLSGTYIINRTMARNVPLVGKWILKHSDTNPEAMVYQLDPDKPAQTLSLLVGDGNVLFFLDKNNKLFTGNSDFSYTLNRRKKMI